MTLWCCWKDLTLPVQIPHPSQARFKFPTPTCLRGGGGVEALTIDWHITGCEIVPNTGAMPLNCSLWRPNPEN